MSSFESSFGITVFLPNCAFEAEINRDILSSTIAGIDLKMTEDGIDEDFDVRMMTAAYSVIDTADDLAHNRHENPDHAVTDIAFSFIYAFQKIHGMSKLIELRGLIGMMEYDKMIFSPCSDLDTYKKAIHMIRNKMDDIEDTEIPEMPIGKTIH